PRARPPERRGALGPHVRRRGGSAGAEPPGVNMPRTRSLAWSELKIGIVAVIAIALAIMLIVAVGGQGGFSWQRYTLKTKFANVQGLKSGAIVRVAGVEVGK